MVTDGWPAWATEKVEVVDWEPSWSQRASELISDLSHGLTRWLVGPMEHVGSTAVPGLAAKPVIDLMAPVGSLIDAADADDVLTEAGWHLVPPELDERPWRRMYVLPNGDRRVAHLHLLESEHPRWGEALLFRDRLRQDRQLAQRYAHVKRLAARANPDDREAYTKAKSDFVEEVVVQS